MTTILAKQFRNGFVMAADSQFTSGGTPYRHPKMEKISRVGELWVAGAGDSNICDVIQNAWNPPKMSKDMEDHYKFMISHVIPSMKSALDRYGVKHDFGDDEDSGSDFLIGIRRTVYCISGWSILLSKDGIYGIGSGSKYGVGALSAGASFEEAITIAAKYDTNTGGSPQIVREGVTRA